mmetsp:Transcript_35488/g.42788  ORF Transcript_35488/g.42788 Transcript_35488/m.42788 type:complete len:352 (-) Transcript_35488:42-1097(-)
MRSDEALIHVEWNNPAEDFFQQNEYIPFEKDVTGFMLRVQCSYVAKVPKYIQKVQKHGMTAMLRQRVAEWAFKVVDCYSFRRENVTYAMSFVDRYLAIESVDRRKLHLLALCSLYSAIKMNENDSFTMFDIMELSAHMFTKNEILKMEWKLMQNIGWRTRPPIALSFVPIMLRHLPHSRFDIIKIAKLVKFLTELAVCDYFFVEFKPSTIALASIIAAIEKEPGIICNQEKQSWLLNIQKEIGLKVDENVSACKFRLNDIARLACSTWSHRTCVSREFEPLYIKKTEHIIHIGSKNCSRSRTPSPVTVDAIISANCLENDFDRSLKRKPLHRSLPRNRNEFESKCKRMCRT